MALKEALAEMRCVHSFAIVVFSVKLEMKLKNVEIDPKLCTKSSHISHLCTKYEINVSKKQTCK